MAGKYAIRYGRIDGMTYRRELCEASDAELVELQAIDVAKGYRKAERVDWREAHAWVKTGNHHSTALYIDMDGRVRYARDSW